MNRHALRPLLACLLGASVLSLAAFAASAQTVGSVSLDTAAQAQVDTDADADATDLDEARAIQRAADRNCLRDTGSRIVAREKTGKQCVSAPGRVYIRDDLDRTGEIDLVQALRKLDTSIGW